MQAACLDLTGRVSRDRRCHHGGDSGGDVLRKQLLGRVVIIAAALASGTLALAALGTPGEVQVSNSSAQAPVSAAPPRVGRVSPAGRTIGLRVVDQSHGKPLPGVRLTVVVGTIPTLERTTDDGTSTPLPLSALRSGRSCTSTRALLAGRRRGGVPPNFTLKMVPAARIGGLVNDGQGDRSSGRRCASGLADPGTSRRTGSESG